MAPARPATARIAPGTARLSSAAQPPTAVAAQAPLTSRIGRTGRIVEGSPIPQIQPAARPAEGGPPPVAATPSPAPGEAVSPVPTAVVGVEDVMPSFWVIGGASGGAALVAVAIWVGIARMADAELNFLVILVGIAAGIAGYYASRKAGDHRVGWVAVAITIAGLFLAKQWLISLDYSQFKAELVANLHERVNVVGHIADGIQRGASDEMMEGGLNDQGYPRAVWKAAEARYDGMTEAERDETMATEVAELESGMDEAYEAVGGWWLFLRSIWAIFATFTACTIAYAVGRRGFMPAH
jgi:hypothetical protein